MKIWICALLAATITLCMTPIITMAATKISTVKIDIRVEDYEGALEIDAESKSDKYDIAKCEFEGELFSYASGPGLEVILPDEIAIEQDPSDAECEIELSALDGYFFNTMQQKNIKITGTEGVCTKALRKDNGATLVLTIKLTGLEQYVGQITEAYFEDGVASWEAASGAATYSVSLYKDTRKKGLIHETSAPRYDFSALMTEPGQYFYKVFPNSARNKKGRPVESGYVSITEEQARTNRDRVTGGVAGWQQTDAGWQYLYSDLVPVQSNWIRDGEDWYFFDGSGYMIINAKQLWKNKWYQFNDNGKLIP